jgi:lysophospholipase L1-like esterase
MVSITNIATGGDTYGGAITEAASELTPCFDSRKGSNVLCLWLGINDFRAGSSPSAVYSQLTSYCALRRATGFKIIIGTVTPCSIGGTDINYEANRQEFNANVRANYSSFADGLFDIGNDANMGQAGQETNTTYYSGDNCHPNNTGYAIVAGLAKIAIDRVI